MVAAALSFSGLTPQWAVVTLADARCERTALFLSLGLVGGIVKEVILTPEGFDKLREEIEQLSTVKRREVAERIKQAREFGDITENSEYDDAKNEQAMLEHRIATLEERLAHARVIEADEIKSDVVGLGSRVRLKDIDANETIEYTIVGSAEANPTQNRLSNESPVGKAILGHKKGEIVEVAAPRGSLKFKILDIKAA
jgi:transcription elongation factor GreA